MEEKIITLNEVLEIGNKYKDGEMTYDELKEWGDTILVRTYINGLPDSFVESARIDGANEFKIFLKIFFGQKLTQSLDRFLDAPRRARVIDVVRYGAQVVELPNAKRLARCCHRSTLHLLDAG